MCSLTALLLQPLTERAYLQSMALLPHLLKQRILVILPRCGSAVLPSVCLSVCQHIAGTAGPIFSKFFVQIPCGCGSVLVWRRCDTLCTSGFMDDVMFGRNGPYGDALHYQGGV